MRRNVFNLSLLYLRRLSCNHELEMTLLSQYLGQRRISCISSSNGSEDFKIKFKTSRSYAETKATNCWNCHRPMNIGLAGTKESFFCSSCGRLQELNDNYNYFSMFGIDEQFQINQNDLTKKFREFQGVLHPDKFSNKNETEQNLSAAISSLVNKAFKTLGTPINRAEYLLKLKDVTIPEDNNVVDKEFLFEIMERNEEVEDANSAEDLKKLLLRVNDDKDKSFIEFDLNLKKNNLIAAKSNLILLRYYNSLETSIKNKLYQLGVVD